MAVKPAVQANATGSDNGGKFVLNDEELTGLSGVRGRKATDSAYLAEVKEALENPTRYVKGELVSGDIHAIRITDTRKAAWIQPQLRKASKQLGIDPKLFTVLDRSGTVSKNAPMGFVAYFVKAEDAPTEPASE